MQIVRILKHIFFAFLITFVAVFGVGKGFEKYMMLPLTHFFVYREGVSWLDMIYKYRFIPSKDIAVVTIDDTTLNLFQKSEQERSGNLKMLTLQKEVYIDLIEKLESVGVKGIAFDIIFENIDKDEEKFAQIMEDYKNVVIATIVDNNYEHIQVARNADGTKCNNDCYTGIPRSVYKNVPWGHVNTVPTHDKRVISFDISDAPYATQKKKSERVIDALPLALYKATGGDTSNIFPNVSTGSYVLEPYFGGDLIVGKSARPYTTFTLSEVLSLPVIQKQLAGKYVFVGESGAMIHDEFVSPVTGKIMSGVESHAHFLDSILQKRFLVNWNLGSMSYFLFVLGTILVMVSVYLILPKYMSLLVAVFMTYIVIFMSRYLFEKHNIVVDFGYLFFASSIFSYVFTSIYRFFILERESRILAAAFSHYVDGRVVDEIAKSGKDINLGGESRRLSILFSDIAGFTTLSEKLEPKDLFYVMSSYLSRMTNILTYHGGTLDKYIGDAVMGFYGAPLKSTHHALDACHTALKMREALPIFNTDLLARGHDPIDFRIGIATGDVVVGNIGSEDRFNYTVLGDTVNLASRLEGTSKEYGTHIIVAESTYEDAKEEFFFRKLDKIEVKGKTEGVLIYELIASIHDTKLDRTPYERYEEALELYFAGKYIEAGKMFETNAKTDPVSNVMMQRCLDIIEGRTKLDHGVYVMTHK